MKKNVTSGQHGPFPELLGWSQSAGIVVDERCPRAGGRVGVWVGGGGCVCLSLSLRISWHHVRWVITTLVTFQSSPSRVS